MARRTVQETALVAGDAPVGPGDAPRLVLPIGVAGAPAAAAQEAPGGAGGREDFSIDGIPVSAIERIDILPLDADEIAACKPIYEVFPGWTEKTFGLTQWDALPLNARRYLERVQALIGAPIDMVSTGPDRDHTILLRHPYQG